MAKRFTETDKWRDPWFRALKPLQKCLFLYTCDNCNQAGFIEIDMEAWAWNIGCTRKDLEIAWGGLSRAYILSEGWAYIRTYLKHQKHLPLNPERVPAHKQIVSLLNEQSSRFNGLTEKVLNGIALSHKDGMDIPLGIGKGIGIGIGTGEGDVEQDPKNESPAPRKQARARNPLMDALAMLHGELSQITAPTWRQIAKALKDIHDVCPDVTPADIDARASNYRTHYPDCSISSSALAKHWSVCASKKNMAGSPKGHCTPVTAITRDMFAPETVEIVYKKD